MVTERRFVDAQIDTMWRFGGGGSSDSLLLMPIHLATDGQLVYFADAGANRLVALHARDGTLAWTLGRPGSGPGEFRTFTALAVTPFGELAVADLENQRISLISAGGELKKNIPVGDISHIKGICPQQDSTFMLATMDPRRPLIAIDRQGNLLRQLDYPWPDLLNSNPLVTQSRLSGVGHSCVLALQMGRGFATLREDAVEFQEPSKYIESFDLPKVTVQTLPTGRRGIQMDPNASVAVWDLTVNDREAVLLFAGETDYKLRLLDVYNSISGEYQHTFLLPFTIQAMTRFRDTFFLLAQDRGGVASLTAVTLNSDSPATRRQATRTAK